MNKPSSRAKKRYISFEIISEQKVFKDEIKSSICNKALEFLGEDGLSRLGFQLVSENALRVDHNRKNEMILILSMIRKINDKNVLINTLKTSGNLSKVKK
ncbi:MAG: Rpp14/Pop5 family protein [Candidatus Nanoarchaeia archaeon]|nr:Rpp14/Pop5 family protein [Candidatus Nanoarchaeia archaeon]MDD5054468.1 Rpp14/Pop5 family protein [Candidatus Nanoarchaeia archaeon]MDD5499352.1 Rpp14/Pop5 family protein [Candidatus Nanoarchaeia archaeon]